MKNEFAEVVEKKRAKEHLITDGGESIETSSSEELENIPEDELKELSDEARTFVHKYLRILEEGDVPVVSPLHVDELATKVAKLYENIRRVIDWKEEHLVRRTAIERILKRRFITEISGLDILPGLEPQQLAEPLVMELMRSGYFKNDNVPKSVIPEVERVLHKYIFVINNSPLSQAQPGKGIKKVEFYNWLLEIAACELEEVLDPPLRQYSLINFTTKAINSRIKIFPEGRLESKEKYTQTYVAVQRSLFNLDDPLITFSLLKVKYKDFLTPTEEFLNEFAESIINVWEEINDTLNHPHRNEFYRICEKYDTAYLIIGDILAELEKDKETLETKISHPKTLIAKVKKTYNARLGTLKKRLMRSATYSTLSIFLAGAVSLVLIEGPLARIVTGEWHLLGMVVDIMIPTAIMFLLVIIIRPPAKSNRERVIKEVEKIIYKAEATDVYEINLAKKRSLILNIVFIVLYLSIGLASLYGIYILFSWAGVPWTSLYIDTANVAVLVFAAMGIRQKAKELTIEDETGLGEFIIDMLSIPLAKIGKWLADKWKEYNFISVFFTALVDMPFSTFVEGLEDLRKFIKERSAEIH